MSIDNVVTTNNLGPDFNIGTDIANRITVNIDDTSIVRDPATGVLSSPGAPAGLAERSPAIATTTGTGWVTKLTGTFTPSIAGTWRVEASWLGNVGNNLTNDLRVRLLQDGTPLGTTGIIYQVEPKDQGGNIGGTGSDQHIPGHWSDALTLPAGTATTFELQFEASAAGVQVSLWDANVFVSYFPT